MTDVPTKAERDQWRKVVKRWLGLDANDIDALRFLRLLDALDTYEDALAKAREAARERDELRNTLSSIRVLLDGNTDG